MRFKIDQNLPVEVADILHEGGHDAVTVRMQGLTGCGDSDLARICQAEQRCMATLDSDFADIRQYPPSSYPGIIVLRPTRSEKRLILKILEDLVRRLEATTPDKALWVVDDQRIRVRKTKSTQPEPE